MKISRKWALYASLSLLAFTVACSNQPTANEANQTNESNETKGNAANEKQDETNKPAADGVTAIAVDEAKAAELQAQFGQEAPAKVVSASVAISEILDVLGVMPIGVPTSTVELPAAFKDVQRIGSALKPDVEQVTKLQPDLVLGPESIKDSLEKQFKPASLKTAYIPSDSLEELKLSMVVMSRVFKQEQKANEFLANLEKQESEAAKQAEGKTAPKVMLLFGSAESFMLMNENTFPGSIAKKLGASNVVSDVLKSDETYVMLNMENVVAANPDVILLVSHGDPDTAIKKFEEDVKKNGAWDKLNAFKNGKVSALDYNLFGVASLVKAADAYKEMTTKLYQ
ncbi:ABC transporter substrate-binding protein [Paenibacillus spongiae]|uniref:ABC transporter substrate-binding protein n=1 Tax=Paenibacillus spongiae TaxID=2909671 RepID=A0ABY5S9U3_9BACL|nr:ABC transporter substrate-binding protein [Paenibacillus spongiae]UVI30692.1 ABC transporter substrate-binding protein [Paenibacillus spongiae]